ncbi:MAG TPA: hypothetical protein VLD57_02200 [Blastocatellia bacterium]|nr:hypothetical protein [Blastocatellia bacterium]
MKKWMTAIPVVLAVFVAQGLARQAQTEQKQAQPRPAQPRLTFAETVKRSLQRVGATIDESKSAAELVVTNYSDPKGGKTTIVIVNDKRKNMIGLYIYNFGSLKNVANREEVYRYLLSANDSITIGSFFVDGEQDIGYKYYFSNTQPLNQAVFESAYLTMATVARERRAEIRRLIGE